MAIQLNKQATEIYAAFNAHDINQYLFLHTDDVAFEQVIADGIKGQGKEELREFVKSFFDAFPDFRCEVTALIAGKDLQCEEILMTGTHKGDYLGLAPTGKSFSWRGVLLRELREGKTCRFSIYCDPAVLMTQLGILPTSP
jgi:steroid delta-isomerase-like uncharacterized protein